MIATVTKLRHVFILATDSTANSTPMLHLIFQAAEPRLYYY